MPAEPARPLWSAGCAVASAGRALRHAKPVSSGRRGKRACVRVLTPPLLAMRPARSGATSTRSAQQAQRLPRARRHGSQLQAARWAAPSRTAGPPPLAPAAQTWTQSGPTRPRLPTRLQRVPSLQALPQRAQRGGCIQPAQPPQHGVWILRRAVATPCAIDRATRGARNEGLEVALVTWGGKRREAPRRATRAHLQAGGQALQGRRVLAVRHLAPQPPAVQHCARGKRGWEVGREARRGRDAQL